MKKNIQEMLISIFIIALMVFSLFVVYQVIRYVFGGSWSLENIIVSLLVLNISLTFTAGLTFGISLLKSRTDLAKLKSDYEHLAGQFRSLADDFKRHAAK